MLKMANIYTLADKISRLVTRMIIGTKVLNQIEKPNLSEPACIGDIFYFKLWIAWFMFLPYIN